MLKFDSRQNSIFRVNFQMSVFFGRGQAYPSFFKISEGSTRVPRALKGVGINTKSKIKLFHCKEIEMD